MPEKYQEQAVITKQEAVGTGIYSLWVQAKAIADAARPGQFVSFYCNEESRLLPRPLSICETDPKSGQVRFVYRAAGKGTAEISGYKKGDTLDLLGPLGNGYPLEQMREGKKALLIGGGIGIPPLVQLSKELKGEKTIVLGFRDELFLTEEFTNYGSVLIATEDGSIGTHGTVLDCILEHNLEADIIFACGPTPMLRALQSYSREKKIECWLSLEERMACGIGACLACVCNSVEVDRHLQVKKKRVCKEGPVFRSDEIVL